MSQPTASALPTTQVSRPLSPQLIIVYCSVTMVPYAIKNTNHLLISTILNIFLEQNGYPFDLTMSDCFFNISLLLDTGPKALN